LIDPALAIAVDVLVPNGEYTLTASHVHGEGLLLHTDLPLSARQVLRLRIHTADDPPPLILLAVVRQTIPQDPEAGDLGTTASVMLTLYHLTPYTRTRWHRWLTWLDDQADGRPKLPNPLTIDERPDAHHLRRLHKLLTEGRAHSRRATSRYALSWQIRLVVPDGYVEAHTRNVSEGGVLIELPQPAADLGVEPLHTYDLVLYHPDDGARLQVPAVIVRAPEGALSERVAARFAPSEEQEAALRQFIRAGIPNEERDDPLLLLDPEDVDE
jgi:hypothetical protein